MQSMNTVVFVDSIALMDKRKDNLYPNIHKYTLNINTKTQTE